MAVTTPSNRRAAPGKRLEHLGPDNAPKPAARQASKEAGGTQDKDIQRSLLLSHDPRFKEIAYYRSTEDSRLNRIIHSQRKLSRLYPENWGFPEPVGQRSALQVPTPEELLMRRVAKEECDGHDKMTLNKFKGRIGWEESFRSNVRKLNIDFELTETPSCRLNHLDRFHDWFTREGRKQARKDCQSPTFLTFTSNDRPLPGSTRDLAPLFSETTLSMAESMHMAKSPRLEKHFSIVPPPPPGPGYK